MREVIEIIRMLIEGTRTTDLIEGGVRIRIEGVIIAEVMIRGIEVIEAVTVVMLTTITVTVTAAIMVTIIIKIMATVIATAVVVGMVIEMVAITTILTAIKIIIAVVVVVNQQEEKMYNNYLHH